MIEYVETGLDGLREGTAGRGVRVREDGSGGAYVIVDDIEIGEHFAPRRSWIGFHVTFAEDAHVYPHFIDPHLQYVRPRLLARELHKARDGIDFVPGRWGYRMLTPQFVSEKIRYCRDQELIYLAVHNHGGSHQVEFSEPDNRSHERGYPALLDISGRPV